MTTDKTTKTKPKAAEKIKAAGTKSVQKKSSTKKTTNLSVDVFDTKGKKKSSMNLPENIFGLKWNADLVHQVVVAQQANARITYAHTKDRSEVRGGGRKPWRQKGTGRARHGSSRSPIWAGGGVTFGPRKEKVYAQKTTKKMRTKAVFTILSEKLRDSELIFVDDIIIKEPKTKDAKSIVEALGAIKGNERLTEKKINTAMILLNERDLNTAKSFRNISGMSVEEVRNVNPVNLLSSKFIIITKPSEAVKFLESKTKAEPVDNRKEDAKASTQK